jgi:hypothetical protein
MPIHIVMVLSPTTFVHDMGKLGLHAIRKLRPIKTPMPIAAGRAWRVHPVLAIQFKYILHGHYCQQGLTVHGQANQIHGQVTLMRLA